MPSTKYMKKEKVYKKKIIILITDPGCLNFISREIENLKKKFNLKIYLFKKIYNLNNIIKSSFLINKKNLLKIINNKYCDLILTGTTKKNISLKKIWEEIYEKDIRMDVFIDSTINIKERFTHKNNIVTNYFNKFFIINKKASSELIKLNVNKKKIFTIDHPNIVYLNKLKIRKRKEKFKRIIFLSEPIIEYRETNKIGYNQVTTLKHILHELSNSIKENIIFYIKPHPLEKSQKFIKIKNKYKNNYLDVKIIRNDYTNYLNNADLCIGMASFGLIEFKVTGTDVLAIQPNRKYIPNNLLVDYKIRTHTNFEKFYKELYLLINKKNKSNKKLKLNRAKLSDFI